MYVCMRLRFIHLLDSFIQEGDRTNGFFSSYLRLNRLSFRSILFDADRPLIVVAMEGSVAFLIDFFLSFPACSGRLLCLDALEPNDFLLLVLLLFLPSPSDGPRRRYCSTTPSVLCSPYASTASLLFRPIPERRGEPPHLSVHIQYY